MNWSEMTSQQQWKTLWNMKEYGGGFASTLADAWLKADSGNSAKLVAAFPELIEKFCPQNWELTATVQPPVLAFETKESV